MNKRYGTRILARNLEVPAYELALSPNMAIIGGSGSGKTTLVKPNLLKANQSLIVSDTKGLLYRQFSQSFKDRGYDVYVLDTVNMRNSCGYNPLDYIRRYRDGAPYEQDIHTVATALMPVLDSNEPFWEKEGINEMEMLIAYAFDFMKPEEINMVSIAKLYQVFQTPMGKLEMEKTIARKPDSLSYSKFTHIKSGMSADKMKASISAFTNEALSVFLYKEAGYIFSQKNSFDINCLGKRPTVLFLNVSDTDRSCDDIVNLFYTQALHTLCQQADNNLDARLEVPVHFILDDFASNTKINNFDQLISIIRSRDISVSIIFQSLSQLETLYGYSASNTIIDNCGYILYLGGGQNSHTAEFVSERVNLTKEEVMCMPRTKICVMKQGEVGKYYDKVLPGDYELPEIRPVDLFEEDDFVDDDFDAEWF